MRFVQRLKESWDRFTGKTIRTVKYELPDLQSLKADIEFQRALEAMKQQRVRFDMRSTPPSEPPEAESTSISGLNKRLDMDDQLMMEVLNGNKK